MADRTTSEPREELRLADEHREIKGILRALGACADLGEATGLLDELSAMLEHHFKAEEGPGGMEDMIGLGAPHVMERFHGLMAEHPAMLSKARDLSSRLRSCSEDIAALIRQLSAHESRECALLSDAFYVDLGGSG